MPPSFHFLSGEAVPGEPGLAASVGEARLRAAEALAVPPGRVLLRGRRGAPADAEPLAALAGEDLQVLLLPDPLEAELARAAGVEGFGDLMALEKVNLEYRLLRKLPDSVGRLRVRELALASNELDALPEGFGKMPSLRSLDLSHNRLKTLPESFCSLKSLRELYLGFNHLRELPGGIGGLASLEQLDMRDNVLKRLPTGFGELARLGRLVLNDNDLKELPDGFGRLASLSVLHAVGNSLTKLPACFGQLAALRMLYLNGNNLLSLPESFGDLANLRDLHLEHNHLVSLPASFVRLSALRKLDIGSNWLAALPQGFHDFTQLRAVGVRLAGNPLARQEDGRMTKIRAIPSSFRIPCRPRCSRCTPRGIQRQPHRGRVYPDAGPLSRG